MHKRIIPRSRTWKSKASWWASLKCSVLADPILWQPNQQGQTVPRLSLSLLEMRALQSGSSDPYSGFPRVQGASDLLLWYRILHPQAIVRSLVRRRQRLSEWRFGLRQRRIWPHKCETVRSVDVSRQWCHWSVNWLERSCCIMSFCNLWQYVLCIASFSAIIIELRF